MATSPGSLLASVLRGIWRPNPPALTACEDEFNQVVPLLLRSGGGGLGWYRIRDSGLRSSAAARTLQQAYRLHCIRAAVHEQILQAVFDRLRTAGVDALLIKGWAVARLYPESGLRPFGDLDIVVRPEQHAVAMAALNQGERSECPVDLHRGVGHMHARRLDDLYAHSQLVQLRGSDIRIPAAEDHLIILIRHFLRHNAWRPLWLCDIAAALESRPAGFDWDRCLSGSRRHSGWVTCTLKLAHQLLGADIAHTPAADHASPLPSWLLPAVIRQWEHCVGAGERTRVVPCLAAHWRHPRRLLAEARARWDMPIAASVALDAPCNEFPRFPWQLGLALSHVPHWCRELYAYVPRRLSFR